LLCCLTFCFESKSFFLFVLLRILPYMFLFSCLRPNVLRSIIHAFISLPSYFTSVFVEKFFPFWNNYIVTLQANASNLPTCRVVINFDTISAIWPHITKILYNSLIEKKLRLWQQQRILCSVNNQLTIADDLRSVNYNFCFANYRVFLEIFPIYQEKSTISRSLVWKVENARLSLYVLQYNDGIYRRKTTMESAWLTLNRWRIPSLWGSNRNSRIRLPDKSIDDRSRK
jgi:hypothetical protein